MWRWPMAFLTPEDENFIRDKFAKEMKDTVRVDFYTQHKSELALPVAECPGCEETKQIIDELASLSDKIQVVVHDFFTEEAKAKETGVQEVPTTILSNPVGREMRFLGLPAGYEFAGLIDDIVNLSSGDSGLSPDTKTKLSTIDKPVDIKVFVTPT
jgi:glutaredoxin-like protein